MDPLRERAANASTTSRKAQSRLHGQLWLTAHDGAPRYRPRPGLPSASADRRPLKLRKPVQDGQHLPLRCGRADPAALTLRRNDDSVPKPGDQRGLRKGAMPRCDRPRNAECSSTSIFEVERYMRCKTVLGSSGSNELRVADFKFREGLPYGPSKANLGSRLMTIGSPFAYTAGPRPTSSALSDF